MTFGNAAAVDTTASFSIAGTYVLRLTASDGALTASDEMTVVVNQADQAPTVDAGADQAITLPAIATLDATVTDDGLPNPPATVTTLWSMVSGPGAVNFANATAVDTTASFSTAGTYVLRLTASDSALGAFDEITIAVSAANRAPIVNAGPDQTGITFVDMLLDGTVTDDGLPNPPFAVTTTWTRVSGPGTVTFGNAADVDTFVSFPTAGTYILRLTANDGDLTTSDEVSITINPDNQPPSADAGPDQAIMLPSGATLDGTVTDDGQPNPPKMVTTLWSVASGPGTVTFTNAAAIDATASFSVAGIYVLRLTASDSALGASDEVTITVSPPNLAPTVSAGPDQTIGLPANATLDGTVTDDGLPNPPAMVTTVWSQLSGPGTATFANATAVDTTASFSAAGVYVLGLTASDGIASVTDEITVTVRAVNRAPIANAGPDQAIVLPALVTLDGTVADDGLPNPPAVSTAWSVVSGPGQVSFANAAAIDTTAGFSKAGTYVLRLTASDGALTGVDDVAVVVSYNGEPLLDAEWHLKGRSGEPAGANVEAIWEQVTGAGIVIGIVDDGLQHTHPDLRPNYMPALSFDFVQNDSDPSPLITAGCALSDCHGTAVAGVAAARGDNGIGVSGVAPLASLAGLRLISAPASDAQEAAALGYLNDAIHISNNSWGPADNGSTLAGPGPLTEMAIENSISLGRGGRGKIFVWAAGNGGQALDNCNFDGYATNRFAIAVGALADTAQAAPYNELCSAMLVTAPSSGGTRGITTTDLLGNAGYSLDDYTDTFGGTSSAAPVVSGTVALMLEANPSLTWRDVQHILVRSSHRVSPGDPGWSTGRYAHSEKFGFGLVDAEAAVALARSWRSVLAERTVPPVTRTGNVPIPDNDPTGVSDSITVGASFANFQVEHVEVEFNATHSSRGNLEVTLTSPSGVVSRLATPRPADAGANFSAWRFRSVRHWGEAAAGSWTLRVMDRASGNIGTWQSWTLRIFGTQPTAATSVRPVGDFDGDGRANLALYRAGTWLVENEPTVVLGAASDVPVPGDYNGDRRTERAVYRPAGGLWSIPGQATVSWGTAQDWPIPADYDGDGRTDIAVFRPPTGTWYVRGQFTMPWGVAGDLPVPGDYSGDGKADVAVFRPSTGVWFVNGFGTFAFGTSGDVPVPADYDGDGRVDIAVWRPASGTWFVRNQFTTQWGVPGDLPVGLDVDGDGRAELVIYRRATGTWFSLDPLTGARTMISQGGPGAMPAFVPPWLANTVSGDMEGDRKADVTVFRPPTAQWFTRVSSSGLAGQLVQQNGSSGDVPVPGDYRGIGRRQPATYRPSDSRWLIAGGPTLSWGTAGDLPVPGDYDGDARTDLAVWRPTTGAWHLRYSSREWQSGQSFVLGVAGDLPVPGDYDGDWRTDLAVFRPGTGMWHILISSTEFTTQWNVTWGVASDVPVQADYDGDCRTDLAIWRPASGTWFILQSSTNYTGFTAVNWGTRDDVPVPADFDGDGRAEPAIFRRGANTWWAVSQFNNLFWGAAGDVPLPAIP